VPQTILLQERRNNHLETYICFTINQEKYKLVILKKLFKPKQILLFKMTGTQCSLGQKMDKLPIDEIKTSTLKEMIKYWFMLIKVKLKLIKYRRN
jgi:hypothetical protein